MAPRPRSSSKPKEWTSLGLSLRHKPTQSSNPMSPESPVVFCRRCRVNQIPRPSFQQPGNHRAERGHGKTMAIPPFPALPELSAVHSIRILLRQTTDQVMDGQTERTRLCRQADPLGTGLSCPLAHSMHCKEPLESCRELLVRSRLSHRTPLIASTRREKSMEQVPEKCGVGTISHKQDPRKPREMSTPAHRPHGVLHGDRAFLRSVRPLDSPVISTLGRHQTCPKAPLQNKVILVRQPNLGHSFLRPSMISTTLNCRISVTAGRLTWL